MPVVAPVQKEQAIAEQQQLADHLKIACIRAVKNKGHTGLLPWDDAAQEIT